MTNFTEKTANFYKKTTTNTEKLSKDQNYIPLKHTFDKTRNNKNTTALISKMNLTSGISIWKGSNKFCLLLVSWEEEELSGKLDLALAKFILVRQYLISSRAIIMEKYIL